MGDILSYRDGEEDRAFDSRVPVLTKLGLNTGQFLGTSGSQDSSEQEKLLPQVVLLPASSRKGWGLREIRYCGVTGKGCKHAPHPSTDTAQTPLSWGGEAVAGGEAGVLMVAI